MHEISLVRNIFSSLKAEFKEEEIPEIKSICLTVGILSNIQPMLMQNAFEAVVATDNPEFAQAKLNITTLNIKIHCDDCDKESEVENYKFVCQHCQKPTNNIIQGNELLISKIVFD